MTHPTANGRIPAWLRDRRWWLLPLLAWGLAVSVSLRQQIEDLEQQTQALATEGARNLFNMVVLTRAWNADHGGV